MANKGLVAIRIGLGLLFVIAGLGKFTGGQLGPGIAGFTPMVWNLTFLAIIVAAVELLGGLSLWIGKRMKYSTALLSIVMIGAIVKVAIPAVVAGQPMALIKLLEDVVVLTSLIGVMIASWGE